MGSLVSFRLGEKRLGLKSIVGLRSLVGLGLREIRLGLIEAKGKELLNRRQSRRNFVILFFY